MVNFFVVYCLTINTPKESGQKVQKCLPVAQSAHAQQGPIDDGESSAASVSVTSSTLALPLQHVTFNHNLRKCKTPTSNADGGGWRHVSARDRLFSLARPSLP